MVGCDEIEAADEAMTEKVRALTSCARTVEWSTYPTRRGQPIVARVRAGDINGNGERDLNDRLRLPFVDTWVYGVTLERGEACGDCAEDCGEDTCHRGVCVPATTSMLTAVAITENSYTTIPIVSGVAGSTGTPICSMAKATARSLAGSQTATTKRSQGLHCVERRPLAHPPRLLPRRVPQPAHARSRRRRHVRAAEPPAWGRAGRRLRAQRGL